MKLITKMIALSFISVTLLSSCSSDEDKKATIEDLPTLETFRGVSFTLDQSEGFDAGKYFSTELAKSYKTEEIDATILPKIDIAFYSGGHSLNYFMSPDNEDYGIKNAPKTLFINYQKDLLTVEQFNKIEKGSDLDSIIVTADDNESFPDSAVPNIVLFKNAAGKKGAIYIKSIHRVGFDPRIMVDIKIQK